MTSLWMKQIEFSCPSVCECVFHLAEILTVSSFLLLVLFVDDVLVSSSVARTVW